MQEFKGVDHVKRGVDHCGVVFELNFCQQELYETLVTFRVKFHDVTERFAFDILGQLLRPKENIRRRTDSDIVRKMIVKLARRIKIADEKPFECTFLARVEANAINDALSAFAELVRDGDRAPVGKFNALILRQP